MVQDETWEADHLEIRQLADALEGPEAVHAARRLQKLLPGHFAAEEGASGFFARMVELGHDTETAERLIEDHSDLLAEVAAVLAEPDPVRAATRARALAAHLRRHERAEARYGATQSPEWSSPSDRQ